MVSEKVPCLLPLPSQISDIATNRCGNLRAEKRFVSCLESTARDSHPPPGVGQWVETISVDSRYRGSQYEEWKGAETTPSSFLPLWTEKESWPIHRMLLVGIKWEMYLESSWECGHLCRCQCREEMTTSHWYGKWIQPAQITLPEHWFQFLQLWIQHIRMIEPGQSLARINNSSLCDDTR